MPRCASGSRRAVGDGRSGPSVVDVTTTFAALTLAGPLAREVFARFCALDLRPSRDAGRGAAPGLDRPPAGLVIREAEERYLFLFGWATGEYMWSVVADAGAAPRRRGRSASTRCRCWPRPTGTGAERRSA